MAVVVVVVVVVEEVAVEVVVEEGVAAAEGEVPHLPEDRPCNKEQLNRRTTQFQLDLSEV